MVENQNTDPRAPSEAARQYATLLLRLHELDPHGNTNSAESNAICEQMDAAWQGMSGAERRRMQGLSEDLYGLADHRAGTTMLPDERKRWGKILQLALSDGDDEAQLAHLRTAFPEGFPPELVAFFQGECWQRFQYLDVALAFIRAAGNASAARQIELQLLKQLGRFADARVAAEALLKDPTLPPSDTYVSATTLYELTAEMDDASARPILLQVVEVMRRLVGRNAPRLDEVPLPVRAARLLVWILFELGDVDKIATASSDILSRFSDPDVLIAKGLALIGTDDVGAEAAFNQAAELPNASPFSYIVLAWDRIGRDNYLAVVGLTEAGLRSPNVPQFAQALFHELRGIALAGLKQDQTLVVKEFDRAIQLDPISRERINFNKQLAVETLTSNAAPNASHETRWKLVDPRTARRGFRHGLGAHNFMRAPGNIAGEEFAFGVVAATVA